MQQHGGIISLARSEQGVVDRSGFHATSQEAQLTQLMIH